MRYVFAIVNSNKRGIKMDKTLREMIWDAIYSITDEDFLAGLCMYEGVKKWENEVKDIVESIEGLAMNIENHMKEKQQYEKERLKGE